MDRIRRDVPRRGCGDGAHRLVVRIGVARCCSAAGTRLLSRCLGSCSFCSITYPRTTRSCKRVKGSPRLLCCLGLGLIPGGPARERSSQRHADSPGHRGRWLHREQSCPPPVANGRRPGHRPRQFLLRPSSERRRPRHTSHRGGRHGARRRRRSDPRMRYGLSPGRVCRQRTVDRGSDRGRDDQRSWYADGARGSATAGCRQGRVPNRLQPGSLAS